MARLDACFDRSETSHVGKVPPRELGPRCACPVTEISIGEDLGENPQGQVDSVCTPRPGCVVGYYLVVLRMVGSTQVQTTVPPEICQSFCPPTAIAHLSHTPHQIKVTIFTSHPSVPRTNANSTKWRKAGVRAFSLLIIAGFPQI